MLNNRINYVAITIIVAIISMIIGVAAEQRLSNSPHTLQECQVYTVEEEIRTAEQIDEGVYEEQYKYKVRCEKDKIHHVVFRESKFNPLDKIEQSWNLVNPTTDN